MREKLIELLFNVPGYIIGADGLADHLIANGVTVQECAEWEEIEDDWNMETIYKCSACKEEFVTIDGTPADNLWNYCPHCGAKMMPQPPKGE
jgi:DNA-directed RNA polymerase subunit RPC12/RpoP